VKGKPSAASVIFNITAICDGPPQVLFNANPALIAFNTCCDVLGEVLDPPLRKTRLPTVWRSNDSFLVCIIDHNVILDI
jgi:hypothetical protein